MAQRHATSDTPANGFPACRAASPCNPVTPCNAQTMPAKPSPLVGVRETCAILNKDKKTVIRWARDDETPLTIAVKLDGKNGAILFDRDEVDRLAKALEAKPIDEIRAAEARRAARNKRRRAARAAITEAEQAC